MSYHRCGGGKQSTPTIKVTKHGPIPYAWGDGYMSATFNLTNIPNYSNLVLNGNFFVEATSAYADGSSIATFTWSYNASTGILTCQSNISKFNVVYVNIRVVSIE